MFCFVFRLVFWRATASTTRGKIGEIAMPKIIIGAELDALCPCWMAAKLGELAREPKAIQIVGGREHAEFLAEREWTWIAQKLSELNTEKTEEQR